MSDSALHPGAVAERAPERPAIIMGRTGQVLTYRELDEQSLALAKAFRAAGVQQGDAVAIMLDNRPEFMVAAWAAQRSGLYFVTVNWHLTAAEANYIIGDSGAKAIVTSQAISERVGSLSDSDGIVMRVMCGEAAPGWRSFDEVVRSAADLPDVEQVEGDYMGYSSGTTGKPRGIRRPLTYAPFGSNTTLARSLRQQDFADGDVYLSPAPLYHTAPLVYCLGVHRLGGTVVLMERFDAEAMLDLISRYRVTHMQVVPTMFVRMLKLPVETRERADTSSLKMVVHAAAPCPLDVKREMLRWWGPVIHEYYGATEGHGGTWITPQEWLEHPGSVGRAILGTLHIRDDAGTELPPGQVGAIWFSGGPDFQYHNDPDGTAQARQGGAATVGDVGYVDADGYLYLTDRKSFTIISGGVNVYPQETENVLISHPKVLDAAVIGVPDADMGEVVKAVVQPVDWASAGPDLAAELIEHCRAHLATIKCPRSIDFERELPRLENGKLYKRVLRDRYWPAPGVAQPPSPDEPGRL